MKKFWLALPVFMVTLAAELPQARLWTIFPPGGKAASTVEVSVAGADLENAATLLFSTPGVTAAPKTVAGTTNIEPNKFIVTIPPDTPPGRCDVRVAGRFGASNPRSFFISTLSEINETEPNNSPEEAAKLVLPCVINGPADSENYDCFRFAARKGERLVFRCSADELDSRLSPILIISDSNGRELAHARKDGLLEFIPPVDGEFVVQLHDLVYKGGAEYAYRLEAGAIPHIDFIEPPCGKPGEKSIHRLLGRNLPNSKPTNLKSLDGKELEEITIEIEFPSHRDFSKLPLKPNSLSTEGFAYIFQTTNGCSNPFPLTFASGTVAAQKNDSTPVELTPPSTYHGRFRPVRETEWLHFNAEKGEVFYLEVLSERLGYPTDPHILVQRVTRNDKGEPQYSDAKELYDIDQNLGGREFNTASRDATLRFDAPEKGEYRVQTRDLFNLTPGKNSYPYTFQIRKESPSFSLAVAPYAPPNPNKDARTAPVWSNFLRKGDKQPVKLLVWSKDGFNGEIGLIAEGLPKGTTLAPLTIPAGLNTATLMLQTATDADAFEGPIRLIGRAKVADKEINVEARALSQTWNVDDHSREAIISRTVDANVFSVSATELAPVSLDPSEEKTWETSLGGKLTIPVNITRRADFNNPLKFRLLTDPPKEWEADGKATNTTVEIDIKAAKLPVGRHELFLLAQTSGKYRRVNPDELKAIEEEIKTLQGQKDSENKIKELSAKIAAGDVNATFWCSPLGINVTPAPLQVQLASSSMEMKPGARTELTVRIARLYDFKDPVEVSVGLAAESKGVAAAKITIPSDQTEGKLVFESATDAPVGEKKATITAIARQNGLELKSELSLNLLVSAPASQ